MTRCKFAWQGANTTCQICGRRLKGNLPLDIYAECRKQCRYLGKVATPVKVNCKKRWIGQKSNKCDIHHTCLPHYRPQGQALLDWNARPEAKLLQLCVNCPDYQNKE